MRKQVHPVIQEIQRQRQVYPELWEHRLSWSTVLVEKEAKAAIQGKLFFYGESFQKEPVTVGTSGVDWSGKHLKHQEWPAYLNRFSYLFPLALQYKATGKEKYALAARAYLQDWISSHSPYQPTGQC
ncbi:MAG: hypothetical protein NC911_11065, partial [Candidatus Omnitrophica bacterium]|nr:hypothetical protein [Candidatus Omnitrophota bacterium]